MVNVSAPSPPVSTGDDDDVKGSTGDDDDVKGFRDASAKTACPITYSNRACRAAHDLQGLGEV